MLLTALENLLFDYCGFYFCYREPPRSRSGTLPSEGQVWGKKVLKRILIRKPPGYLSFFVEKYPVTWTGPWRTFFCNQISSVWICRNYLRCPAVFTNAFFIANFPLKNCVAKSSLDSHELGLVLTHQSGTHKLIVINIMATCLWEKVYFWPYIFTALVSH